MSQDMTPETPGAPAATPCHYCGCVPTDREINGNHFSAKECIAALKKANADLESVNAELRAKVGRLLAVIEEK